MIDLSAFEEVSEFYDVEKTIIVVIDGETIRIEAVRRTDGEPPHRYQTRASIERSVMLTPEYGADGSRGTGESTNMTVWVSHPIPWTDGDSADAVLVQALSLMRFP